MATFTFTISGDQLASYTGSTQTSDGVTLTGVSDYSGTGTYTVTVQQSGSVSPTAQSAQKVTVTDSDGNIIFQDINPKPNQWGGYGAGDQHLILPDGGSGGYVIDLGGFTGTTVTYGPADEDLNPDPDVPGEFDWPCFAPGTLIATPEGERAVESLQVGDRVLTVDNGATEILWWGYYEIDFDKYPTKRRSVEFKISTDRTLVVSAQHRMLRTISGQEVLIPAVGLTDEPGVREMKGQRKAQYVSFMTAQHEVIWANGQKCETFYPGEYIMKTLPGVLRDELYQLFPLLRFGADLGYGPGARPFLTARGKPVGNAVRDEKLLTFRASG